VLATVTSDPSWHELAARGYAAFRQLIEYWKMSGAIDSNISTDAYLRYVQRASRSISCSIQSI
ncbi:hypothetical protein ACW7EJ_13265, partial [Acinetobacter soli]